MIGDMSDAAVFSVELRIDDAGQADELVILGAGSEDNTESALNADETGWDLVLPVEPSEDRAPYDAALRAAGFEPIGDDKAIRR